MIFNTRLYVLLAIASPRCFKLNLYVRTTPQGSSSHMLKQFFLWGSFTKRLYSFDNGIQNNLHTLFLQASYSHMIFLQVLVLIQHEIIKCKLWAKNSNLYLFIYLEERSEWIINHIHVRLFPMHQTNHHVPLITFHPYG